MAKTFWDMREELSLGLIISGCTLKLPQRSSLQSPVFSQESVF